MITKSESEIQQLAESGYQKLGKMLPGIKYHMTYENAETYFMQHKNSVYGMSYPLTDAEEQAINIDLKGKKEVVSVNIGLSLNVEDEIIFTNNYVKISDYTINKNDFGIFSESYSDKSLYQRKGLCCLFALFSLYKMTGGTRFSVSDDEFNRYFRIAYDNIMPQRKNISPAYIRGNPERSSVLNIAKTLLEDKSGIFKITFRGDEVTINRLG